MTSASPRDIKETEEKLLLLAGKGVLGGTRRDIMRRDDDDGVSLSAEGSKGGGGPAVPFGSGRPTSLKAEAAFAVLQRSSDVPTHRRTLHVRNMRAHLPFA